MARRKNQSDGTLRLVVGVGIGLGVGYWLWKREEKKKKEKRPSQVPPIPPPTQLPDEAPGEPDIPAGPFPGDPDHGGGVVEPPVGGNGPLFPLPGDDDDDGGPLFPQPPAPPPGPLPGEPIPGEGEVGGGLGAGFGEGDEAGEPQTIQLTWSSSHQPTVTFQTLDDVLFINFPHLPPSVPGTWQISLTGTGDGSAFRSVYDAGMSRAVITPRHPGVASYRVRRVAGGKTVQYEDGTLMRMPLVLRF